MNFLFRSTQFLFFLLSLLLTSNAFAQKPNVVFIIADDLGYADLGCYGQTRTETPNLDKLAREGFQCMNFYSGSTVCAPARATLMSGLHTGHSPVRGNKTFLPEGQTPLPDSLRTIINILQDNGYATGAFGKWSLGFITTPGDPQKKGFDEFFGYNCQSLAHNYYPDHLWSNHDRIEFPENKDANATYSADTIHNMAKRFLQKQTGKQPFFLYLPYTLPHRDLFLPHDSVYDHYVKKFNEAPVMDRIPGKEKYFEPYLHAAFSAMVSRLDRFVGEIMQLLKQKGFAENTLVIFCSDNGPHQEGGGDPDFFKNHGIYRGIKRDLYEGGIRAPFIAYWKEKIAPQKSKELMALWDMFPTFQELAKLPVSKSTDGISTLPRLFKKGKQVQHEYLYWEFNENSSQALRWKNWKAVKLKVNTSTPVFELYDLDKDPGEKNNVAELFPGIVEKMNTTMQKEHTPNKDWPLLPEELKTKIQ